MIKKVPLRRRKHKYGVASKADRQCDGFTFDSRRERDRYVELKLLRAKGEVAFFLQQGPLMLPGNVRYRVDFVVFWESGHVSFEDVKGVRTKEYLIKKKGIEDPSWIYGGYITIDEK